MNNISIIIPTYTAYQYLDLCLESICKNQHNINNEIIVVVDGTYHLNKNVIEKWKDKLNIKPIIFEENRGLAMATNYGFYNAVNDHCLLINDDNVCPAEFDKILFTQVLNFENHGPSSVVLTPNQIEPRPSIFKPFIIKNFGETTEEFNLNKFTEEEILLRKNNIDWDLGWTFPIFLRKNYYLNVGGLDPMYNSPHVIDWELFHKLSCRYHLNRIYSCNFYHFGSKSARTYESYQKEQLAHEYFKYKWGFNAYNKLLQSQ